MIHRKNDLVDGHVLRSGADTASCEIRAESVSHELGAFTYGRPMLSDRESQVLLAWLGSDSKPEAARRLYISTGTMNTHITRIRAKYAAVGRPAATKAALFAGALQDGYTVLADW